MTDSSTTSAVSEPEAERPRADDAERSPAPADATENDPGLPLNLLRGGLLMLAGALAPFCIMAADRHFSFSVPVGVAGCALFIAGAFDLLGTFNVQPRSDTRATTLEGAAVLPRLLELLALAGLHIGALRLAVAGVLPKPILTSALLVTGTFLALVVGVYRLALVFGAWKTDELGAERTLLRREGFWLVVLNALLYLPMLGSFSLSDPWETHYGEVAREMLARDDWISLWWAQDGWFWSKPILDFWMQGLSFHLLGARYMPDQMLASVARGAFPSPEWAARMPVFLLTLLGSYFLYKGVSKSFGRRAGLIGALILTTMPYWYLLAHQTMTDMPYVAPLAAGMGLLLLGFHTDPNARASAYRVQLGRFRLELSLFHLVFAVVLLCVVPQILYLLSRNVTLQLPPSQVGFRWHPDEFFSGSGGGNCGLPGNENCSPAAPRYKIFQPWLGALVWSAVSGVLLWINREERRVQRLYYIAGWFFVALSAMAKGAPGLVIPVFVVGIYIGATKRWVELTRLEIASMALIVAAVILPWYVQMYMRHGAPFIDRLLFHDMYKRAFVHVHDTNTGDDTSFRYYIWQLGYGLFPWTGLAAGGLVWWLRKNDETRSAREGAAAFMLLWFVAAFSMFTITLTKFHHYILPAVPPIAMLTGLLIDRALGRELPQGKRLLAYLATLGSGALLAVYGLMRLFPGSIFGELEAGKAHPPQLALGIASLVCGVLLAALGARRFGSGGTDPAEDEPESRYAGMMLGAVGLASAIVVAIAGRDMFTSVRGDIDGSARLTHLFSYNYRRPFPDSLDFSAVFIAFTIAMALASALFIVERARQHAAVAVCAVAVLWGAWGVNVYHVKTAPHYGQRETVLAYYARRSSPKEPFVAYQMNWKGENFYTGNRTPAFVSSGQRFRDWIAEQKKQGVNVMFFTTEHSRIGSLKNEIGAHKKFELITTPELNNKFTVARVEL